MVALKISANNKYKNLLSNHEFLLFLAVHLVLSSYTSMACLFNASCSFEDGTFCGWNTSSAGNVWSVHYCDGRPKCARLDINTQPMKYGNLSSRIFRQPAMQTINLGFSYVAQVDPTTTAYLRVIIKSGNDDMQTTVWNVSAMNGKDWQPANVSFQSPASDFQVVFEGIWESGGTYASFGLDDITLVVDVQTCSTATTLSSDVSPTIPAFVSPNASMILTSKSTADSKENNNVGVIVGVIVAVVCSIIIVVIIIIILKRRKILWNKQTNSLAKSMTSGGRINSVLEDRAMYLSPVPHTEENFDSSADCSQAQKEKLQNLSIEPSTGSYENSQELLSEQNNPSYYNTNITPAMKDNSPYYNTVIPADDAKQYCNPESTVQQPESHMVNTTYYSTLCHKSARHPYEHISSKSSQSSSDGTDNKDSTYLQLANIHTETINTDNTFEEPNDYHEDLPQPAQNKDCLH